MPTPVTATADLRAAGGRLVSVDGRTLPLESVSLTAEAAGGIARDTLRQTFHNPWDQPLKVSYTMPLPVDGAVSGFRMTMGDTVIHGRIESRETAQEEFERALLEGRTAGLLDQERRNVFILQVGNVPAGARVETELVVDQRLLWLADGEGGWEWRFPTVVAPRYLGAPGRTPDASRVEVDVAETPLPAGMALRLIIGDDLTGAAAPASSSHPIRVSDGEVTLEGAPARLDRDVVVRWGAARPQPGVSLRTARPAPGQPQGEHTCGLLTIVPPAREARTVPRDLILLLDTSGSMSGLPLERLRRAAEALIWSLGEADSLEMVAFDSAPRRWHPDAVRATDDAKRDARAWVGSLQTRGGTEMVRGLVEALRPLREDSQRQVVLLTDGLIGFESEVVALLRDRLPRGARLHTVGVGEGVNRALTGPAARAGRGAEVIIGLHEPAEAALRRIVAATRSPVLTDLRLEGSALIDHVPRHLPDVMAGSPCLAAVRLRPAGGDLTITARSPEGEWRRTTPVPPVTAREGSPAILALYAREAVEDLEMDLAAGSASQEIDDAILDLGLRFGISTRLTSWVAISTEKKVDPRDPVRTVRIPQELPSGLSAEGLGLRAPWGVAETVSLHVEVCASEQLPCSDALSRLQAHLARQLGLKGRWLPRTPGDGFAVLEITVRRGRFDWAPEGVALLERQDGSSVPARILPEHSTRKCRLRRGETFRVALEMDDDVLPVDLAKVLLPSDLYTVAVFL